MSATVAPRARNAGMTLVELMVAMSIGLFLIGGALFVYSQGKSSYRVADSVARLQESARFAIETMEPDIRLARYWGQNSQPAAITVPPAIPVVCAGGGNVRDWALNLVASVEARDDNYDLACDSFGDDARPGSDVLVIRRAEPAGRTPTVPDAGRIQVQASLFAGQLFDNGVPPDLGPDARTFDVAVHAYYVSRQSSFDETEPSLRRLTLKKGRLIGDDEIISGVENLQVQFGVDTDLDGNVDRYVDGDHPLVTPGAAGFDPDAEIAAVRLWLLVSAPADDLAWQDNAAYPTPDGDLGPIQAGTAEYPANRRRIRLSKTIFLRNQGV